MLLVFNPQNNFTQNPPQAGFLCLYEKKSMRNI